MLRLSLLACFLPFILAVPPVWYPEGPCGKSKYSDAGDYFLPAPTIVGGIEARYNEFPWQVSLKKGSFHFCGGSIINKRWILTASHCLKFRKPEAVTVVVGLQKHSQPAAPAAASYHVEKLIVNENYTLGASSYDVSLIKLKSDIKFSDNVGPVCAPDPKDSYAHVKAVVSGWGTVKFGDPAGTDALRYTTVNTTTNQYCHKMYANESAPITDDMICASDNKGSNERDACQGDSGGPLVVKSKDGTFRLIGAVSWGIGCASGYPGVYGRVGYFNDWILKKLKE